MELSIFLRLRQHSCDKAGETSKREKAPAIAGASAVVPTTERLLERGLDAGEGRVQLRAEALDDGDDCNRDAGGDEAVLDGGRARLVLKKARNEVRHSRLHRSTRGCLSVIREPLLPG